MVTSVYSSGLVAESCWFLEFKEFLRMKRNGLSDNMIKTQAVESNCFNAPNEYRAGRIYGYIKRRADTLDDKAIALFFDLDLSNQKILNLICILRNSRIFFEFLNEVYKEKVLLGTETLEAADVNIFFKNKATQSDEVAGWKDATLKRLRGSFLTILTDSGLLADRDKKRVIKVPITDILLEKYLEANGETDIIKAMTGAY